MFTDPNSTPTLLLNYNFKEEAKYYKEYRNMEEANHLKINEQIPNFFESEDILLERMGNHQKEVKKGNLGSKFRELEFLKFKKDLSSLILQQKDIDRIKLFVGSEQSKTVLFNSINWKVLRKSDTYGNSFYLSEDFLNFFKIEKYKRLQNIEKKIIVFKSAEYIDCLLLTTRIFSAFRNFEDADPNAFYDFDSFVSEETISYFIELMIPQINSLKDLRQHKDYYIPYATTLIMTFLTSYEKEKIPLKKLLFSKIFIKFINLDYDDHIKREKHRVPSLNADDGFPNFSSSSNVSRIRNNPFSLKESKHIYETFIKMDSQKSGYLTINDVKETDNFLFTNAFLDRLFHNVLTETAYNDDRFDYTSFLRFYVSLNFMKSPRSVDLFFDVADIDGDGVISNFDILYFYKEMIKESKIDKELHSYDRFYSELLDITKCNAKEGITKQQIYINKVGNPFFFLLFDIKTFIDWESPSSE
ncbi:Serine/threonine-protein phosphatase 2A regulatory subunit B'' subunit gamma [Tritrichomonas musculus]|uniref:Serine/threonine-protein phosphatase 2A regulatory subunit B'' subunit gamma n=1 Tax=Tritrichomonas musculus TaxID=1915356 RepID=A0ABR2ILR3_9EUKA